MANTQLRSYKQLMDGTITLIKMESNFLKGKTWITSDDNTSILKGLQLTPTVNDQAATKYYVDQQTSGDITTFVGLTDTPNTYLAGAGKMLAINSGANALEFVDAPAGITLFKNLTDTPATYGVNGQMLVTDGSSIVFQNQPTPPTIIDTFIGLTDTPSSFTADQLVAVNSSGDALEYVAKVVDTPSELEKITEGGKTGWILRGQTSRPGRLSTGDNAVDLITGSYGSAYATGATGDHSHAEGYNTLASGQGSHAEGYSRYGTTIASGSSSHAEGYITTASGTSSHAEGYFATASGNYSHAQGNRTTASGNYSHAEGRGGIALNEASHAAGKYNLGTATDTIHETGIGTSTSNRANAFEIYTDGRIIAPALTGVKISAAKSLTTKEYVDGLISTTAKGPDSFATTAVADYPSDYKGSGGITEGDPFVITDITLGNQVGSQEVQVGDMLIAMVDSAGNTDADWVIIQTNTTYATESTPGTIQLATQTEADTGTDSTKAITPAKLAGYIQSQKIDKIAGAGLVETASTGTFDIVSADSSVTVGADDIKVQLGSTNGDSLEVTATGVELKSTISGDRTFSEDITIQGTLTTTIGATLSGNANTVVLSTQPTGTVDLAVATTKYVDDNIYVALTEVYNEQLTVVDGNATTSVAHAPATGTQRVYLNGVRQAPGSGQDYTISGTTITFTSVLQTGDTVLVDYKY